MWLFLPFGVVSVVQCRDDADVLLVRARAKETLTQFLALGRPWSRGQRPKVVSMATADYPFRCWVPPGCCLREVVKPSC